MTSPKPGEEGRKFDQEKPRWDLIPWRGLAPLVDVLTFGAKKYAPENWRKVPEARRRYFAAAQRHLVAWQLGETKDPETGLPHLDHAVRCILFRADLEQEGKLE